MAESEGRTLLLGTDMKIDDVIEGINLEIAAHDDWIMYLLLNRCDGLFHLGYGAQALLDARAGLAFSHRRANAKGYCLLSRCYKAVGNEPAAKTALNRFLSIPAPDPKLRDYVRQSAPAQSNTPFDIAANTRRFLPPPFSHASAKAAHDAGNAVWPYFPSAIAHYTIGIAGHAHVLFPLLRRRAERYIFVGLYDAAMNDIDAIAHVSGDAQACIDLRVICQALWDASLGAFIGDTAGRVKSIADRKVRAAALRELTRLAHEAITDLPPSIFIRARSLQTRPHANFYGPIEVRLVRGKGRGLFTTADVKAGQLLIRESTLFAYDGGGAMKDIESVMERGKWIMAHQAVSNHFVACCRDLMGEMEPTRGARLPTTILSRRPARNTNATPYEAETAIGRQFGSAAVAQELCNHVAVNAFSEDARNGGVARDGFQVACHGGVWPVTSFMNHDTACNTTHVIWGRIGFIRAMRDMPAGTELTLSYVPPGYSWQWRRDFLEDRGFIEPRQPRDFPPEIINEIIAIGKKMHGIFRNPGEDWSGLLQLYDLMEKGQELVAKGMGKALKGTASLDPNLSDPATHDFCAALRDVIVMQGGSWADIVRCELTRIRVKYGHQECNAHLLEDLMLLRAQFGNHVEPHIRMWLEAQVIQQLIVVHGYNHDAGRLVRILMEKSLPRDFASPGFKYRQSPLDDDTPDMVPNGEERDPRKNKPEVRQRYVIENEEEDEEEDEGVSEGEQVSGEGEGEEDMPELDDDSD